jgi:hypothetical protein
MRSSRVPRDRPLLHPSAPEAGAVCLGLVRLERLGIVVRGAVVVQVGDAGGSIVQHSAPLDALQVAIGQRRATTGQRRIQQVSGLRLVSCSCCA